MSLPLQWANTIVTSDLLQKEVIRILKAQHVVVNWANTKYEWELKKQGDTVRVQTFPRISFSSWTTAWADITASTYAVTSETLTADKIDQVRIEIADLQKIVSNLDDMSLLAQEIAYSMNEIFEKFVIGLAVAWALTANKLYEGWAVTIDKSNIYSYVDQMAVRLQEVNAWVNTALFVTPNVASLIRQSPLFDWFREWMDVRKTWMVWRMSTFEIYRSNYIPADKMLAMDKDSVHFVNQMTGMKTTDAEKGFRTNLLSEIIYWGKVFSENSKRICTLKYA